MSKIWDEDMLENHSYWDIDILEEYREKKKMRLKVFRLVFGIRSGIGER